MDTFEEEEVVPLTEIAKKLKEVRKAAAESSTKIFEMLNELKGTSPEAQEELSKFIELMKG